MLPNAGNVDRVRSAQLADALYHVLRREAPVGGVVVAKRIRLAPLVEQCPPAREVSASTRGEFRLHGRDELGDHLADVANDRHIGGAVLADLGWIDVGVNHQRLRGESLEPARPAASEESRGVIALPATTTVQDLAKALSTLGASARDLVSILQAMKAAGALDAELEVI